MKTDVDIVETLRAAGCVFAEDEAEILIAEAQSPEELVQMVDQRCAGLPLEHVVGWADFCGRRINVVPGVFVPRPRTEFLVSEAVKRIPPGGIVFDMCCGSGAISAAIINAVNDVEIHASDIDPVAVTCARTNITAPVYESDLFVAMPQSLFGRVSTIVANVPYVPTDEIALLSREARIHEPNNALDGGPDGLDILRCVARDGLPWLAPGGSLLIEVSINQARTASHAFTEYGFATATEISEELEVAIVVGTRLSL